MESKLSAWNMKNNAAKVGLARACAASRAELGTRKRIARAITLVVEHVIDQGDDLARSEEDFEQWRSGIGAIRMD